MKHLIQKLINEGYLKTPAIIDAFYNIKREDFMPAEVKGEAGGNYPLPIGYGQTISQPLTVAFMLELLQPQAGDRILDVGAGSGWQTALLAWVVSREGEMRKLSISDCQLMIEANMSESDAAEFNNYNAKKAGAGKVYAIERIPELMEFGKNNVAKYNFVKSGIVEFFCGDGSRGLPERAPFDKIIAAAAASTVPEALKEQLKIGGRLVLPVGSRAGQDIILLTKEAEGKFAEQRYPGFIFVPLVEE